MGSSVNTVVAVQCSNTSTFAWQLLLRQQEHAEHPCAVVLFAALGRRHMQPTSQPTEATNQPAKSPTNQPTRQSVGNHRRQECRSDKFKRAATTHSCVNTRDSHAMQPVNTRRDSNQLGSHAFCSLMHNCRTLSCVSSINKQQPRGPNCQGPEAYFNHLTQEISQHPS
jgi:hypothetical protein